MPEITHFFWIPLLQIFVAFFLLAQGVIVFIQKPKSKLHQSFFLFQFPIALWLVSMGFAYLQSDSERALLFARLGFLGVMYIPVSTYAFSVYFYGDARQEIFIYAGIFLTSLLSILLGRPEFVRGVDRMPWGYYISLGPWSLVTLILFIVYIPLFIRNFYKKYLTAPPEQKRWHLWALVFGGLAYFASIDFIPAFGIRTLLPPFGFLLVGSFVTLMGYFMLRHHLSDLKIIFGRSVGYVAVTTILFFIYLGFFIVFFPRVHTTQEIISNAILFIFASYTLSVFQQKSQKIVDEIFIKEKIDYNQLISQFNSGLRNLSDIKTLLASLFTFFTDTLRVEKSYIFIYEEQEHRFHVYDNVSRDASQQKNVEFSNEFNKYFLLHQGIIDWRDYEYHPMIDETRRSIYLILREYEGKILIPLLHRSQFRGFIVLGEKMSREGYSLPEKSAMKNLVAPFSIAWENAKLYESIQSASRAKTDFVSIASHQLRTPLSGLRWSANILLKKEVGELTEEQKDILQEISKTTERMIEIVNQLLDVVHIEEKESRPEYKFFELDSLVEQIILEKSPIIKKGSIALEKKISKNARRAYASEKFTKTVLSILLDNALKYSPFGGTILVCASVKEEHILVSVRDTGIGIPKKEQGNIFSKFFRASNAQRIEPNGSGLGLYYAKTLVEKQGGEIWFRSEENRGTTLYFTLRAS